jgi:hypothetical protein
MEPTPAPAKKNAWYGKIETEQEALKVIKDASYGFFFIAILQGVIGLALGMNVLLDAILYLIFAGILLKFKSRVAAILLLLLSAGALVVTFVNKLNPNPEGRTGGTNIVLAVIMLWAAVRAIQATFKFHKLKQLSSNSVNVVQQ